MTLALDEVRHDVCAVDLTTEQASAAEALLREILGVAEGEVATRLIVRHRVKPLAEAGPILTDIAHGEPQA